MHAEPRKSTEKKQKSFSRRMTRTRLPPALPPRIMVIIRRETSIPRNSTTCLLLLLLLLCLRAPLPLLLLLLSTLPLRPNSNNTLMLLRSPHIRPTLTPPYLILLPLAPRLGLKPYEIPTTQLSTPKQVMTQTLRHFRAEHQLTRRSRRGRGFGRG